MVFPPTHAALLILALSFPLTPEGIQAAVSDRGADRVLFELSKDSDALAQLERHIASAEPDWLSVGLALHAGCDAGLCHALHLAFAEALLQDAPEVLAALDGPVMLAQVCGNYEPSGPGLHGCLLPLQKRRKAVTAVSDPRLAARRDECLSRLAESERLAYKQCQ